MNFLKNGQMSKNLGKLGVLRHDIVTLRSSVGPRHGQEEAWDQPRVRRGIATVHSMENFVVLFCFAFPLL